MNHPIHWTSHVDWYCPCGASGGDFTGAEQHWREGTPAADLALTYAAAASLAFLRRAARERGLPLYGSKFDVAWRLATR